MTEWQPVASLENLKARAQLLADIRAFFAARNVMEVETPLLCRFGGTDPYIQPVTADYQGPGFPAGQTFFLQTSPEYCMKRLLAAGAPDIYQITKVFRQGERGHLHNPEFSMIEWYRLGFTHHDLMDEIDTLLQQLLKMPKGNRMTYEQYFMNTVAVNPFTASDGDLWRVLEQNEVHLTTHPAKLTRDDLLNLISTHLIEPRVGFDAPCFVYDFPPSMAALAKIRKADSASEHDVGERFEVYVCGMELANGFHELSDSAEQAARFDAQRKDRVAQGFLDVEPDSRLLAALAHGLPNCAGVALGFDRLLMLQLAAHNIDEVISFTIERA